MISMVVFAATAEDFKRIWAVSIHANVAVSWDLGPLLFELIVLFAN
jgi:hypothetical protein